MCRIFGFRSVIQSQVHQSLVSADNALAYQSQNHPDGWGVAYYVSGAPHIVKSATAALNDHLFRRVSGVVSSETVVAHIRKATQGQNMILNTHPFQYGRWVFVHNGHVKDFARVRPLLLQKIAPRLRRFVLGDTDSELIFYLILTHLSAYVDLDRRGCQISILAQAVRAALKELEEEVGPFCVEDRPLSEEQNYLSFVMTNGEAMIAHQGGKRMFYSTYKKACGDRDVCPSFAYECEHATKTGYVNHLIFSSEPLSGENVWIPMEPGQMIGVDWSMKLTLFDPSMSGGSAPVKVTPELATDE